MALECRSVLRASTAALDAVFCVPCECRMRRELRLQELTRSARASRPLNEAEFLLWRNLPYANLVHLTETSLGAPSRDGAWYSWVARACGQAPMIRLNRGY